MKKNIFTAFILVVVFFPSAMAGGGWVKKKGSGYYKLTQWWVVSDEHFVSPGLKDPNITTGFFNTSIYVEHGITDRITGLLYFPFLSTITRNAEISGTNKQVLAEGESFTSLGDADLSIKYGITKPGSAFVLAGTITFGIPIGNNSGGSDGSLQTGDGEFNQLLRFDLSRSFSLGKNKMFYGNVYSGINNRTNNFSDEFRLGAEIGVPFLKSRLWVISRLDKVISFKNGISSAEGSSGATVFANNTEFTSLGGEIAFKFNEKMGISYSLTHNINGSIIFAGTSHSIGIFLDL